MRRCSRAAVRLTTPPTSDNRHVPRRLWRGGCFPGGAGAGTEQVGAAHLETTAPVEAMGPHSEATPTPHHTGHLSEREPAALQPKRPNFAEIDPGGPATARAGSGNLLTARHTRTRIMTYAHRLTGYRITQGRASTAHHRTTLSVIHVHQCYSVHDPHCPNLLLYSPIEAHEPATRRIRVALTRPRPC